MLTNLDSGLDLLRQLAAALNSLVSSHFKFQFARSHQLTQVFPSLRPFWPTTLLDTFVPAPPTVFS